MNKDTKDNIEFLEKKAILMTQDIVNASLASDLLARQIQTIEQGGLWIEGASEKIEVIQNLYQNSQILLGSLSKAFEETISKICSLKKENN